MKKNDNDDDHDNDDDDELNGTALWQFWTSLVIFYRNNNELSYFKVG